MIPAAVHQLRRAALATRVPDPVLLLGNAPRSRNLPLVKLPFRQDSTLLYFTGCRVPSAAALLVDGRCTVFLPDPDPDDPLWHGPTPSFDEVRATLGVDEVAPRSTLWARVAAARPVHTLAVADEEVNREAAAQLGRPLRFATDHGDPALVDAVIAMRRSKGPEELAELRSAAAGTARAFRATMAATTPGSTEHGLWTLFEAMLRLEALVPGYGTILSQSGEILHNEEHGQRLADGRLLLLDGGGERASGYGVDITRAWPVSGRFTPRQRSAYDAVLAAQRASIARCTPGTPYRDVHTASCRVLARWLVDERLLVGDVDSLVEDGAHAVFFPHGVGHLLGLDVHDLEHFGDRPAYPPGVGRPEQFGTRFLRLNLPLEQGWVVTVEPGFYVVPPILADRTLRERFAGRVDFSRAEGWIGFGGIRIEDDVVVAPTPEVLTDVVPKEPAELEAVVGAGPTVEQRFA
jgi:Xaa-Pro aminopeptidase